MSREGAGAEEDWDEDGMSNRGQYIAGTSPANSLSALMFYCCIVAS
jgi:hypothetical protein